MHYYIIILWICLWQSRFNSTNPRILFTRSAVLPPRIFWLAGRLVRFFYRAPRLLLRWDVSHQEQWARQALTHRPAWYPTPPIPSFLTMMSGYMTEPHHHRDEFFPLTQHSLARLLRCWCWCCTSSSSCFKNKFVLCIDHVSYLILLRSRERKNSTCGWGTNAFYVPYSTTLRYVHVPFIRSRRAADQRQEWMVVVGWYSVCKARLHSKSQSVFSCRLTLLACGRESLSLGCSPSSLVAKYSQNS